MSDSRYAKVLTAERMDYDDKPSVPIIVVENEDNINRTIYSTQPVDPSYAYVPQPYSTFGPPTPPPPPPGIYQYYDAPEPGEECALFGCWFSWIPIVGIMTYILNCDAPMRSRRAFWARTAFIIAILVILFSILYSSLYYYYGPGP